MSKPNTLDELRQAVLTEFKQVLKLAPADYTENCTNVVMSLFTEHSKEVDRLARIDELQKALAKAIEFYEYGIAPHRFAHPINQSLEKRVDQDAVPTKELVERIAQLKSNKGEDNE